MGEKWIFTGLAYPAVESVIRLSGFRGKRAAEIFEDIQIMEGAALEVLNNG